MNKKIVYSLAIALMVFLAACSSDDNLPQTEPKPDPEVKPEIGRTISITASLVDDDQNTSASMYDNGPTTRVSLTPNKTEGKIEVRWEDNDRIELAYLKNGAVISRKAVFVTSISNNGNTAHFDIPIPDGLTGDFKLFGVYGKSRMNLIGNDDLGTDPVIIMPTNLHEATSLNGTTNSVQSKQNMVIYFEHPMKVSDANAKVIFNHLGSFFNITVLNSSATSLTGLDDVKLTGVESPENVSWAYNGGGSYNLITKQFTSVSHTNELTLQTTSTTLEAGKTLTYWAWNPTMGKTWPTMKFNMKWAAISSYAATQTATTAPKAPVVGKNYYFYAVWDGNELNFTDSKYTPKSGIVEVNVATAGSLTTTLTAEQKTDIMAMKVTGNINPVDFLVMKIGMPKLWYLDLSEATCYDENGAVNNTIPANAFGGYDELTRNTKINKIILPNSVTSIGNNAFYKCSGLAGSLNLPAGLTSIGDQAFLDCSGISGPLTIPNGLITVGKEAFKGCTSLTETLIFPLSLTTIGARGFCGCINIDAYQFPHINPIFPYTENMLCQEGNWAGVTNHKVKVPLSVLGDYQTATGWSALHADFPDLIEGY